MDSKFKKNPVAIKNIDNVIDRFKTPFNSSIENIALESVRHITTYCNITEDCKNCKISSLIFCTGKLNKSYSPFSWCDIQLFKDFKNENN